MFGRGPRRSYRSPSTIGTLDPHPKSTSTAVEILHLEERHRRGEGGVDLGDGLRRHGVSLSRDRRLAPGAPVDGTGLLASAPRLDGRATTPAGPAASLVHPAVRR